MKKVMANNTSLITSRHITSSNYYLFFLLNFSPIMERSDGGTQAPTLFTEEKKIAPFIRSPPFSLSAVLLSTDDAKVRVFVPEDDDNSSRPASIRAIKLSSTSLVTLGGQQPPAGPLDGTIGRRTTIGQHQQKKSCLLSATLLGRAPKRKHSGRGSF